MSLLISRRDLDFLLFDWLNVDQLCGRERYKDHGRDTFTAAMDTCEAIATDHFATHNKKSDQQEPRFIEGRVEMIPEVADALAVFRDAGLFGLSAEFEDGGMQLPMAVASACTAYFQAANVATTAYPFLTIGAANLIKAHGSAAQIEEYARPMFAGRYFGTMCLSEPQAGSSLGDITTKAVACSDGSYRLFGAKMWISGGDQEISENIVHMVLGKIEGAPAGAKGISLFLVPKYLPGSEQAGRVRNDVALAGLNHKMGYRGATNTLLKFGEGAYRPGGEAGALGWLVGNRHEGLNAMFHMMNEARIGVGLGATALGYTGYLHALSYARTRLQGRSMAERNPASPQIAIIEHGDVKRMLLTQKAYVEGSLALNLFCAYLTDEFHTNTNPAVRTESQLLLDLLTPVAKSYPSQMCLEANNLAIQIHGGYGYTRDYPLEQFYRDNRLNAIHEGTHGIQALDLLGRKILRSDGRALEALAARVAHTIMRAQSSGEQALQDAAQSLQAAFDLVRSAVSSAANSGDQAGALTNASAFLEAFGHVVMSWLWLEQALATIGMSGAFYEGKRHACRFYFASETPKIEALLRMLVSDDRSIRLMRDEWF